MEEPGMAAIVHSEIPKLHGHGDGRIQEDERINRYGEV
jgi:hypothetical protein